jgi:hypothetical protein
VVNSETDRQTDRPYQLGGVRGDGDG